MTEPDYAEMFFQLKVSAMNHPHLEEIMKLAEEQMIDDLSFPILDR